MVKLGSLTEISSGGLGIVYSAEIVGQDKLVAIKKLKEPYDFDDKRRFAREVRIMSKLKHPNIVSILGSKLDADPPRFVMPLAAGNLNDMLAELRLDEERRHAVFQQILSGVQYAHENGVIHRDLKPQNILVFPGDRIAITDFGLGRFINRDSTTITRRGDQFGTMMYAAPEMWNEFGNADSRSDVYSLGKIFYEMVTSRPVFPVPSYDGLDGRYVYMIQRCLQIDPERRYQSVSALADDFALLTRSSYPAASPIQLAQELTAQLVDPFANSDVSDNISELIRVFIQNPEDEELYTQVLPYLPDPVVVGMLSQHIESFKIVLSNFDVLVAGQLPYDYCDVVATFYQKLFRASAEFEIKRLIVCRLLELGHSHNRWHVGRVLGGILTDVEDPGLAMLLLDECRNNAVGTTWTNDYIDSGRLHTILRNGIQKITTPADEGEIPF